VARVGPGNWAKPSDINPDIIAIAANSSLKIID